MTEVLIKQYLRSILDISALGNGQYRVFNFPKLITWYGAQKSGPQTVAFAFTSFHTDKKDSILPNGL